MYYLPVKINDRRIHYCELRRGDRQQTVFSFLVNVRDTINLLSIKQDSFLISDSDGYNGNIDIRNISLSVNPGADAEVDAETKVRTCELRMQVSRENDNSQMRGVSIGNNDDCRNLLINWYDWTDTANQDNQNELMLKIVFVDAVNNEYMCTLKFHFCGEDEVMSAALDFGSEASQIYSEGGNVPLVRYMCDVAKYSVEEDYWQGKPMDNSPFFKSIFWINLNPDTTRYADSPMNNGDKTFVQVLNKYDVTGNEGMRPLPNLKLLDMVSRLVADVRIEFHLEIHPETNVNANSTLLSNSDQQENIMHLLLTNFLHALLYRINDDNPNRNRYLNFVVLSPNVYYQDKVYKMVENLYEDFYIIKGQDKYTSIKGIEVSVLSESDASFLGCYARQRALRNHKENDTFLIIDAGKGTTDFSIMRRTNDPVKFESCYRCGMPASGNAITYSFFEALNDAVRHSLAAARANAPKAAETESYSSLVDIINKHEKNYSELLELSNLLDDFKINYGTYKENDSYENFNYTQLSEVLDYLRDLKEKHRQIPFAKEYVEGKGSNVQTLTDALYMSLGKFMSRQIEASRGRLRPFAKVMLTGRGFCFQPFAELVKNMLISNGWIDSKNNVISMQDDSDMAKRICMEGAINTVLYNGFYVNNKSLLVGSPTVSYDFRRLFVTRNIEEDLLSDNFYYQGFKFSPIGRYNFLLNNKFVDSIFENGGDRRVFFVGSCFLEQIAGQSSPIKFRDAHWDDGGRNSMTSLSKQSLFPFNSMFNENDQLEETRVVSVNRKQNLVGKMVEMEKNDDNTQKPAVQEVTRENRETDVEMN